MASLRYQLIGLALKGIAVTGIDRLFGRRFAGCGVILTFHHVRAATDRLFPQNTLLEVTPTFLEQVLRLLKSEGYDIIPIDAMAERIANPDPTRPFAVITFDDGYIDNRDYALPILKRYDAPFTVFVNPGFLDRTATLWWLDLEDALRRLDILDIALPTGRFVHPCSTPDEKIAAFSRLYWNLRDLDEAQMRAVIDDLVLRASIDPIARVERLCMDWRALKEFARDPLVTIGAHTNTHPRLKKVPDAEARSEIFDSKTRIERELGREVRHFAYPVGDPTSAGQREFDLCREAGYASAVTTRPGVLFPEHAAHMMALPRISVNGLFQNVDFVRALVLGLPLMIKNRGKRLNVD